MALRIWGRPVYVFHPIVHNEHVTEALKIQGAIFIDDIEMAAWSSAPTAFPTPCVKQRVHGTFASSTQLAHL
jgi:4-hydroxy-3-methylbut-2-enyl diphosphate reductase IspH